MESIKHLPFDCKSIPRSQRTNCRMYCQS